MYCFRRWTTLSIELQTTNRPGQIDDSFISRITAAIQYPRLTQEVRNDIWQRFFEMYEKSGKEKLKITPKAKKELRQDTTELNGREIRNSKYRSTPCHGYRV